MVILFHGKSMIPMNLKFLLGVATGVAIALYIKSPKSKRMIEDIGKGISDSMLRGEETLQNASDKIENLRQKVVQHTITSN